MNTCSAACIVRKKQTFKPHMGYFYNKYCDASGVPVPGAPTRFQAMLWPQAMSGQEAADTCLPWKTDWLNKRQKIWLPVTHHTKRCATESDV